MQLTNEQREQVAAELKQFAGDLNLNDQQKEKLREFLTDARTKLAEYMQANPHVTRADIIKQVAANRDQLRQRLVNFLSPEQLTKWDTEVAKAKEFLGQKLDA